MVALDEDVRIRMPPMPDAAILVHRLRMNEKLLLRELGIEAQHPEAVLKLVAETEGAALLVVGAAGIDAAGERLVLQPIVVHHVERDVAGLNAGALAELSPMRFRFLETSLGLF